MFSSDFDDPKDVLPDFDRLRREADARGENVPVVAVGGDELTVLEALRIAADRGWIAPNLTGTEAKIREVAVANGIDLTGFTIHDTDDPAATAVALCREGHAAAMMKGRIATPDLLHAILRPEIGLRSGRVICQVVLMEIPRDHRRFLMSDTGIMIRPRLESKIGILRNTLELARTLGLFEPRIAMMTASESVHPSMPETYDAAEVQRRADTGEFPGCVVQGPLSFDLAYNARSAGKKRVEGPVVGAADAMIFPDLTSANLTVKAIMYTADCRFGGILMGTTHPIVFMSRADTTETRLNSIALALTRIKDRLP